MRRDYRPLRTVLRRRQSSQHLRKRTGPLGNEQQAQQSAAYAKEEQTTPQPNDDPGDIVIGVNGDADTYMLRGEEYIEGGAHAASPSHGVLTQANRDERQRRPEYGRRLHHHLYGKRF